MFEELEAEVEDDLVGEPRFRKHTCFPNPKDLHASYKYEHSHELQSHFLLHTSQHKHFFSFSVCTYSSISAKNFLLHNYFNIIFTFHL